MREAHLCHVGEVILERAVRDFEGWGTHQSQSLGEELLVILGEKTIA